MKLFNSKIFKIISLVVIVIAIILFFKWSVGDSNKIDNIKVGIIAPLSGPYGAIGESFKKAVELSAMGDTKISLVFEDSKFDPKIGLSAYKKLISIDNVDIIINVDSPTLEAITPEIKKSNIPTFQIFEAGQHENDSIFQILPFTYPLFSSLASLAEQKYERIALVYSNSADIFITNAEYFKKGIKNNQTIVNETKITTGTDFRTEVTKILADNPEAITVIMLYSDGVKFIKEIENQKGNKKVALICDANIEMAIGDYTKVLGNKIFEGCISTNLPDMMTDDFKKLYSNKYGSDPIISADWGYDTVAIIKKLENLSKDKWLEKIQNISLDGVSGLVKFDNTGTRLPASESHIFKEGKFIKQ